MDQKPTPVPKIRAFAFTDALIVTVMAICFFAAYSNLKMNRPVRVVVYRQNTVAAEYPLGDDIAFTVSGKRGDVGVEIKDGTAAIRHADCPRSICKLSGGIRYAHEQLICAPNHILIEIRSVRDSDSVDAISY